MLNSCLNKYRVFFIIWNQSWPYALIIMSCVLEKCRLHFLWRLNSALFILPFDLCVKILLFRSAFHFTLVYSTGISIDPLFYVVLHYLIKFKKNLWLYFQIFEIYFLNRLKLPLFVIFIFFLWIWLINFMLTLFHVKVCIDTISMFWIMRVSWTKLFV
jgi:hypothetical protein